MRGRALSRRGLVWGAGAALTSSLVAACASEQTSPSVPKGPEAATPFPVIDEAQVDRIMKDVAERLSAADQAHDPAQLAPRIVGTAAEARTRAYEIIGKAPEFADQLIGPSGDVLVPITSISADFPRQAIAVVRGTDKEKSTCFVALTQQDARSPYVTWGWAFLVGSDDLPQVKDADNGAQTVAADASGLVMSPQEALARYANVLSAGDGQDPDDKIETDDGETKIHQNIQAERAKLNEGVAADSAATISETYQVHDGEYLGLRTADGGALVMATMRSQRTVTVQPNATVTYTESVVTKMVGTTTFTHNLVQDSAEVVALYIPTADSGDKIRSIGISKSLLGAQGS